MSIAELQEALHTNHPLVSLREKVAEVMKEEGLSEAEMLVVLQQLRDKYHEEGDTRAEDFVLDAMDFLVGWCSPHMRIRRRA